jgi:hypothetical protein
MGVWAYKPKMCNASLAHGHNAEQRQNAERAIEVDPIRDACQACICLRGSDFGGNVISWR